MEPKPQEAPPFALKYSLDNIDEAQPPFRHVYAQDAVTKKWTLVVEGDPYKELLDEFRSNKERLVEFRSNNRGLVKTNTELELLKAQLEEKLKGYEAVPPVDPARLTTLEQALAERDAALAAEKTAHAKTAFVALVGFEATRLGLRPEALDYFVSKASETFRIENGKLTTSAFSRVNPSATLTLAEWMAEQLTASAFAFKPSVGGGASPHQHTPNTRPGKPTVSNDPLTVGQHLAEIASGQVLVRTDM
jgi:hypothetical protein